MQDCARKQKRFPSLMIWVIPLRFIDGAEDTGKWLSHKIRFVRDGEGGPTTGRTAGRDWFCLYINPSFWDTPGSLPVNTQLNLGDHTRFGNVKNINENERSRKSEPAQTKLQNLYSSVRFRSPPPIFSTNISRNLFLRYANKNEVHSFDRSLTLRFIELIYI